MIDEERRKEQERRKESAEKKNKEEKALDIQSENGRKWNFPSLTQQD